MSGIAVFGCKHTTLFLLEWLSERVEVAQVITLGARQAVHHEVADYCDLTSFCEQRGLPRYQVHRYSLRDQRDHEHISALALHAAFVIGWQRLIPEAVLAAIKVGAFGMHGSADNLPRGRGRSPLNWSLIERRQHFHTNLIRYDAGVDSGAVVDRLVFSIRPDDTAETLHFKNTLAMKRLIDRRLDAILVGNVATNVQAPANPTFYPKRSPADSQIDWGQDVFQLDAFIRAVTRPFNGAFSFVASTKVVIWRAAVFETDLVDLGYGAAVPGTLVEVFPSGKFLVRCRGGLLIVHEFQCELEPEPGMQLTAELDFSAFPRNRQGYHDVPAG